MDALPLPELWRLRTPSCLVRGVAVLKDEGGVAGRVARDDFLLLVCLPLDFVGQEVMTAAGILYLAPSGFLVEMV